ncbi:hypothetical protein GE09DRAFT_727722 [Coniochaeta sp. 2T2.1]|nr:hypothetical protein GE09DRAFT_727722 [Coniochaeta sp. 2T2.1]
MFPPNRVASLASLAVAFLATLAASERQPSTTTAEADVVVIGGGAAGVYGAIGLLDRGLNVLVVEKQADLGGHADTYTNPNTGQSVNAGVQVFHNSTIVKEYAARLGVPMVTPTFGGASLSVDFTTGNAVAYPGADPALMEELARYIDIFNTTYPYLNDGFFLPEPVPEDLVLPFGEFARKHQIESVVFLFNQYTQGWDIATVPALYALVVVNVELATNIQTGSFLTLHDTNDLYRSAAAILGERVLYNATIASLIRGDDGVTVEVRQKCRTTTVRAKRLLMTGPPVLDNLHGWDLVQEEKDLFAKFHGYGYFAGAISNLDLPDNTSFVNVAVDAPFHTPQLPAVFGISDTPLPQKTRLVYYGTQPDIDHDAAAAMCIKDIDKLVRQRGYGDAKTKLLAWYPHGPFNIGVSPDDIRQGFYKRLYALQGERNTYWSGATWQAQDSAQVWAYTKTLIEPLARSS